MSQHDSYGNAGSTQTMVGLGQPAETRSAAAAPGRLGAGVGATGQLFETDGVAGSGPLVIKLYTWGAGLGPGVVQDFTRQALRVAKVRHPHVVQVVDAGSLPGGTPFVVMERLAGATLEERTGGMLIPLSEMLPILRGLASGLAAAHANGVAHGELRADNVFMANVAGYAHGFPKLLDFGVAGLTAAARSRGHDVAEPSPDAVPPEQRLDLARGDDRSDQFALAALAYRFLAGAEVTPAVELVLTRAMNWHPSRRFDSVTSFVEALEEAVRAVPQAPPAKAVVEGGDIPRATEAGSLTQQFFAEGERMEQAIGHGASVSGSLTGTADAEAGDLVVTDVLDRVPRSRAPMVTGIALVLTSLAIVGWTAMSLSEIPRLQEPPSAESPQPPPAAASIPAAPATAAARTASMALRARPPVKVAARLGRPPTAPPPVRAPASPLPAVSAPATSTPAAPLAAPPPAATAAAAPTPPIADEPSAAPAAPVAPPIDEGVTQLWEQTDGEPQEETPAASAAPQL
jgi:hypothetical protein